MAFDVVTDCAGREGACDALALADGLAGRGPRRRGGQTAGGPAARRLLPPRPAPPLPRLRPLIAAALIRDCDPASSLFELSREVDLLVPGFRGCGPIGRVLLGGVGGRLARRSVCPLIVVPRRFEQGVAARPRARPTYRHGSA